MKSVLILLCFFGTQVLRADITPTALALSSSAAPLSATAAISLPTPLSAYYQALGEGNVDEAVSYLDLSFTCDGMEPGQIENREAFAKNLKNLYASFPSAHLEILDSFSSGEKIAVRFLFRGKWLKPFHGMKPNGKEVKVYASDLWDLKEARLLALHGNFDALSMLVQMGLMPKMN